MIHLTVEAIVVRVRGVTRKEGEVQEAGAAVGAVEVVEVIIQKIEEKEAQTVKILFQGKNKVLIRQRVVVGAIAVVIEVKRNLQGQENQLLQEVLIQEIKSLKDHCKMVHPKIAIQRDHRILHNKGAKMNIKTNKVWFLRETSLIQ